MLLENKTAAVTGGGRGIGEAVVERLAGNGARVALLDKNGERAREAASRISGLGGPEVVPFEVDITSYDQVKEVFGRVLDRFGRLDILVNNAGWDIMELFIDNRPEFWTKILDLNLKGHMNCCHVVLPGMIRAGYGKIVNISSEAGRTAAYGETAYAAAKGGLISFTRSLAQEVSRYGVCVNSVAPGPTETPMLKKGIQLSEFAARVLEERKALIPMKRFAQPGEIADAVLFFASPLSDYVTGQVLGVSGGLC